MKLTCALMIVGIAITGPAAAQTAKSTNDVVTAYGARLQNPADQTADRNQRRLNTRIDSRINNRLSLRLERYRVPSAQDAYQQQNRSTTQAYDQADVASRRGTASTAISPSTQQQSSQVGSYAPLADTDGIYRAPNPNSQATDPRDGEPIDPR